MSKIEEIRKLIKAGDTEEAIELLLALSKGNKKRYGKSLLLSSRFQKWKEEKLIFDEDKGSELIRINHAVLDMVAELEKENSSSTFISSYKKELSIGILSLLGLLAVYVMNPFSSKDNMPKDEFSISAYIQGPEGPSDLEAYGEVRLRLGDYLKTAKVVGTDGDVIFEGIPPAYWKDSLKLEFTDYAIDILSQSAFTPQEASKITFEVQPRPMRIRGKVYLEGHALANARIVVDHGISESTANAQGEFELLVPKLSGSRSTIIIYAADKEVFRSIETLSNNDLKEWSIE